MIDPIIIALAIANILTLMYYYRKDKNARNPKCY